MKQLPQHIEIDIALSVIWTGICEECRGGSFEEDFAHGRQKIYDYDLICDSLKRFDHMLYGIELACGGSAHLRLIQGMLREAIRDCTKMRAEML